MPENEINPRSELRPEPELRQTKEQPKGVLQKNLKTFVYLGAALLVIVAVLCGLAFSNLIDARHPLLGQVDPASLEADQLELAYVNQETGVRGYVLSGNPAFLQPYLDEGVSDIALNLTGEHPAEQLEQLVAEVLPAIGWRPDRP